VALMTCPECKRDVSSLAETCIHCGYPLAGQMRLAPAGNSASGQPAIVQTVELTGKKYKLYKVIAGLLIVMGIASLLLSYWIAGHGSNVPMKPIEYLGVGLAVIGTGWMIAVEGQIWWHHR
jgi:hypothetical protein